MEEISNTADDGIDADGAEAAEAAQDEALGDGLTNANIASIDRR